MPKTIKPDILEIIVAIDRNEQGWILDATQWFYDVDLIGHTGEGCEDNGFVVPKDVAKVSGVYRVTDVEIGSGQDTDLDCYTEMWGNWTLLLSIESASTVTYHYPSKTTLDASQQKTR